MKQYEEMAKKILKEMYGIKFEELLELSKICKKYNIDWYKLFFVKDKYIDRFPSKSKYRKNKIAIELFKEPMGIMFNYVPCSNEDTTINTVREMYDIKNKEDKEKIIEIANKVRLNFS
jgi:hypothetical protein